MYTYYQNTHTTQNNHGTRHTQNSKQPRYKTHTEQLKTTTVLYKTHTDWNTLRRSQVVKTGKIGLNAGFFMSFLYWQQPNNGLENIHIFLCLPPLNSATKTILRKKKIHSPLAPLLPSSYAHGLTGDSGATCMYVCMYVFTYVFMYVSCGDQRSRSGPGGAVPLFNSHIWYLILRPVKR